MPLYEMRDVATGVVEDIYFTMDDAPEIGTTVEVSGRPMLRIPSVEYQRAAKADCYIPGASSLPRARWNGHKWLPPQEEPWHPPNQKYDDKGKPVFETLKKREEFLAHGEGTYAYGSD